MWQTPRCSQAPSCSCAEMTVRSCISMARRSGVTKCRRTRSASTLSPRAKPHPKMSMPRQHFLPPRLVAGQKCAGRSRCISAVGASSDLLFDLELSGITAESVTRGPYLQIGTPTSVIVRWRTNIATNSRVHFGTDPVNLDNVADDPALKTEHEVMLSGLLPDTQYFYSVGTMRSSARRRFGLQVPDGASAGNATTCAGVDRW